MKGTKRALSVLFFDEPIAVKDLVPDDLESLKSIVYKTMEASIEKHS